VALIGTGVVGFEFSAGPLDGLVIVEPRVHEDARGSFAEQFRASGFDLAGLPSAFVQWNRSTSRRGVLRGLHFQRTPAVQGKLIRVSRGRAWDVCADLRPGSGTYGHWHGLELSEDSGVMLWIPGGFAHGFLALEDGTEFEYLCTAEYDPAREAGVRWDDPALAIEWPEAPRILSDRDAALPFLDPEAGVSLP